MDYLVRFNGYKNKSIGRVKFILEMKLVISWFMR